MHSFTGAVEVNHSFSKIELKSAEQCASTLVAPLEAYLPVGQAVLRGAHVRECVEVRVREEMHAVQLVVPAAGDGGR